MCLRKAYKLLLYRPNVLIISAVYKRLQGRTQARKSSYSQRTWVHKKIPIHTGQVETRVL